MTEKKANSIEFARDRCIKCTKCVLSCKNIGIGHLLVEGEGKNRSIGFSSTNPCVNCGQCTLVCPVFSMREQSALEVTREKLADRASCVIVQCAPSVRVSLGEMFGLEHSPSIEKKLNSCLRVLGFDRVFDVNFGADITSVVEADELLERLERGEGIPMFTSCCPSWVSFVKNYRPELAENLTSALSPHIHAGFAYKTWWAERESIDPKTIVVISIMPCTAKKDEIREFRGLRAVDHVLTVRELAKLISERNIDFANLEESEGDSLAEYSGGAVIYGKSGGVMESALRVIKRKVDGEPFENLQLQEVTGEGYSFREATVRVGSADVRVAVIASPKNFRSFLDSGTYRNYHYIEIMNCPGGCLAGGGQPLLPAKATLVAELLEKRRELLQSLGAGKPKRNALDNGNVLEYLDWVRAAKLENQLLLLPAL
ncbi:MAG: hypothetical protein LBU15_03390 [Rickettsiales bacterium]|jgi:iron-only hydrogenase group A|nr:hypothetical protein [Rickettsiales bacterium]